MNDAFKTVTAAILVIGDEILSGRTKDKNIGYIAEYLTASGIDVRFCMQNKKGNEAIRCPFFMRGASAKAAHSEVLRSGVLVAEQTRDLAERAQCARHAACVELAVRGHFAVRRRCVDHVRQHLRQQARHHRRFDARLRRHIRDGFRAEHVMQRVGGDRLVFARADPRADDVARAVLLEALDQTVQAARLVVDEFERGSDQRSLATTALRRVAAAEHGTEGVE